MSTRFMLIAATLGGLWVSSFALLVPLVPERLHIQKPSAVAACYAVQLGAWDSVRLGDSLRLRVPKLIELTLQPTPDSGIGNYPFRALPARLPGLRPEPTGIPNWGIHYHGGINVGWDYPGFMLNLYLNPERGTLRGFAGLHLHDSEWRWRSEMAPVVLTRASCN